MNYLPPFFLSAIAMAVAWKEDFFIFVILDAATAFVLPAIILIFVDINNKLDVKFLKFGFIDKKILFGLMIGCGSTYLALLYWALPYWFLLHNYLIYFFASINLIIMIKNKSG